jgi:hypothetical protein
LTWTRVPLYAGFVARRTSLVAVVSLVVGLALAPAAAAKPVPVGKFKVVAASGSESLTFHEEDHFRGRGCVGTTTSEVSWQSTRPKKFYVFVRFLSAYHRRGTILSADRVATSYEYVPLPGNATTSTSVDYQETSDCSGDLTGCPKTTVKSKLGLLGTPNPRGGVGEVMPYGIADCAGPMPTRPWSGSADYALGKPTRFASAIPRKQLVEGHQKVLKDNVTVRQRLGGKFRGATVSGTWTNSIKLKLKRLKL